MSWSWERKWRTHRGPRRFRVRLRERLIGVGLFTAATGLLSAAASGSEPAGLKTMPVSEVRAGMKGYGLSVFEGTEPARFDVEVIGVLHNFRPDQDLVLIKTPHPLLEHTGSVAGMSGSPIYLDGRLLGAYAYGWSYGKDPIAGVTPIVNMLKELERPRRPNAFPIAPPLSAPRASSAAGPGNQGGYRGEERRHAFWSLEDLGRKRLRSEDASTQSRLVPCATPLLVGGVTAPMARVLREQLGPLGLEVLEAGTGASSTGDSGPAGFVDGGSIAVTLMRGDIQATAVGTVTHVAGKRAIAFGHPMLDAGEVGLPTATSRVIHVLASERSSFKMAEAIKPLGALIHDRQSAIVVDSGVTPAVIPVRIHVRGVPGLPRESWNVEVVSHRLLTPSMVLTALGSAVGASLNDNDDMMFRAQTRVQIKGQARQDVVDEGFAGTGISQIGALSRLRVFDLLEAAYANPFEKAEVERVEIDLDVRFGHQVTELVSAQLTTDEIDPGASAKVVLTLQAYDGPIEQRIVEVPVPASLAGEQVELEVQPGDQVRLERPIARNLTEVLANVRTSLPGTSLVLSVQRKSRGMTLAGHVVRNLPGSMLDSLATGNDTARTPLFVTQERTVLPMGRVITGQAKLSLSVRKEKQ
ncbi:MAG: SpoIVB peptidase S55 domain-containing protein [Myxococcales bacterium]